MSDINDLFKQLAEEKAKDPKYQQQVKIKENVKGDLGSLFSQLAEEKSKDPKVIAAKKLEKEIKENVKLDLGSLFSELESLNKKKDVLIEEHPELIEEVVEDTTEFTPELIEEVITEVSPLPTPIGNIPSEVQIPDIDKYLKSPKQPQKEEPAPYSKEFKTVNDKIKFLEQWIGKIQNAGPGSGEVNLRYLDDVDRSSIGVGKYLTYNPDTKKFYFQEISGGGVPQIQSDWTENSSDSAAYIKNKPTLFSGSYDDLTNLPILFSGSYDDLTNKPSSISWINPSPSPGTIWRTMYSANENDATITIFEGIPNLGTAYRWKFDTTKLTFPDNSTQNTAWTGTYSYNNLTDKPTLFSGSYTDLTNKPTIPSLTGYATETFVNTAISNVVGAAPAALDTLKEIADQLASDESAVSSLTTTVAGKVSLTGSYANPAWITSLAYGKLTGAPTNVSTFTNDSGYLTSVSWTQVSGKPAGIITINDIDAIPNAALVNKGVTIGSTSVSLGGTIIALTGLDSVTVGTSASVVNNSPTDKFVQVGTKGKLFDDGNLHIHASSGAVWINSLDGGDIRLGTQTNSGKSSVVVDTTSVGHSFFTKVQTGFNVNEPSVSMDNLNVRLRWTGTGSQLISEASAISGSFSAYVTIVDNVAGNALRGDTNASGITFSAGTWTSINANFTISAGGDMLIYHVIDNTNSKIYRVTAIHCAGTKGGYLSIERMC